MALVALVTGGSRGLGRGCAIGLGEAGATVWVTGRTGEDGAGPVPLPGSVGSTAAAVDAAGGRGVARPCDHTDNAAVEALFAGLPPLDVLVNGVWGGYERSLASTSCRSVPSGSNPCPSGTTCRGVCAARTLHRLLPRNAWSNAAEG
jgi:NAD(P)-dependent dehydrogenase (short-subunit alcohol dehydrogenase family)